MILYHFTAATLLDSILAEGLSRGDVPVDGPTAPGLNAVWLTSSAIGDEHGLGDPVEVSDADRTLYKQWRGFDVPENTHWADKREARIKIKLSSTDRALKRFLPWGRKRMDASWLDALIRAGGGKRCADTWWVYFGTIEPSAFIEVAIRDRNGSYVSPGSTAST